jgi:hypothetical protein
MVEELEEMTLSLVAGLLSESKGSNPSAVGKGDPAAGGRGWRKLLEPDAVPPQV